MSRYIDADDFITNSKKHYCDGCDDYNGVRCRACWVDDMCNEVDCTPTADVVEAVRCKDCKHYNEYDNGEKIIGEEEVHDGWCMRWSGIENVNRHDYCSYGERAEE